MIAATVEIGFNEKQVLVEGVVVFCFKHAAHAVLAEESVESVGVFGRGKVDMEAGGGRLPLNGGKVDVRVLEDGVADRKKVPLRMVVKTDSDPGRLMAASLTSFEAARR